MLTNNCLPKYFYGDKMSQDEPSDKNILNFSEDVHLSEPNLSSIPSPCSSLASTKKLEWDSGADIGYTIYDSVKHSRKSKSYPSLIMDLKIFQSSDNNSKTKLKSHSSTGAKKDNPLGCIGEGDTLKSPKNRNKKPKSFKHSTPLYYRPTVKSSCAGHCSNEKATSPILMLDLKDECLQTTLICSSSKEVQTEFDHFVDKKQNENKSLQTDMVDISDPHTVSSSSSKSGSFQYIPGSEIEFIQNNNNNSKSVSGSSKTDNSKSENLKSDTYKTDTLKSDTLKSDTLKSDTLKSGTLKSDTLKSGTAKSGTLKSDTLKSGTLKSNTSKSDTSKSSSYSTSSRRDETDSGSCSPLGQMISTQYSKNLIADIDKSLNVLQKFIKSKNYSNDTKKHYAKKIVTKIINNRYSEDTDSSNNSENTKNSESFESISDTYNKISEMKTSISNKDLYDNAKKSTESCKITDKSFDKKYVECGIQCDEINKKSQIITDRNDCKIKESLEKLNALQKDLKNWRDAQTLSEKLFEARKTHKSRSAKTQEISESSSNVDEEKRDYLIQHSKNERKRQLFWINNEISYLQKLKDLLQFRDQSGTSASSTRKSDSTISKKNQDILDIDDVEKKFNEEFGPLPSDKKSHVIKNDTLDKLSKYLTNEQIKFILDHDVHKKPESEKKIDSSYNSHKNSIYEGKRPSPSKRTQHTSSSDLNLKTSLAVDAATQFDVSEKRESAPLSPIDLENPPFCKVIHRPEPDQSYSSSGYDESVILDKENVIRRIPQKIKTKTKLNKGSTAYFLTFEEESPCELDKEKPKILEQVVVKIPKYRTNRNASNKKSVNEAYTLEEYLLRNRPNFVRTANWRWTQVRSLDFQEKRNLFTCQEMKEMAKRKYNNLPEIQEKVKSNKTESERKHNRFMANMFSKKLQRKTLQGHICLAHCKSVLTSD